MIINRTTSEKNSWAHETYEEIGDQEEVKESDDFIQFREKIVARISQRHYKLSDYLPVDEWITKEQLEMTFDQTFDGIDSS